MKIFSYRDRTSSFLFLFLILFSSLFAEKSFVGYFEDQQLNLKQILSNLYVFSESDSLKSFPTKFVQLKDFQQPLDSFNRSGLDDFDNLEIPLYEAELEQISNDENEILEIIQNLSQNFVNDSGNVTRASGQNTLNDLRTYLCDYIFSLGYSIIPLDSTEFEGEYPYWMGEESFDSFNIRFGKPGNIYGNILITAHFDSISEPYLNHYSSAPGADNDASGVAALLEIAKLISESNIADTSKTITFAIFGANEQGLLGSYDFVNENYDEFDFVFNIDGIGYHENQYAAVVQTNTLDEFAGISNILDTLIETYTLSIAANENDDNYLNSSDAWPFLQNGIFACNFTSGNVNPAWNTENDIIDSLNTFAYLEYLKLIYAAILHNAIPYTPPTSLKQNERIETSPFLIDVFPNPFNIKTTIYLAISDISNQNLRFEIYNLKGQKIKKWLISDDSHTTINWDGSNQKGDEVSSGIYFGKIVINDKVEATKRMILLK